MSESKSTKPQRTNISKAATPVEIGEFWDTNSLAEFWDATHEVDFKVRAKPRKHVVVENRIFRKIEREAKVRGVAPDALINLWLAERLRPSKTS
jgi:hypothetical protein